jgi:hypothetical protein
LAGVLNRELRLAICDLGKTTPLDGFATFRTVSAPDSGRKAPLASILCLQPANRPSQGDTRMRTFVAVAIAFIAASSVALAGDTVSATINPYTHLDESRAELAAAYPELTDAELDRLVFKIADARSIKTLDTD